jgi:hypothetical protein
VDDPNTIRELVEATGVDAPKENSEVDADEDDNDELKGVPKGEDLLGCQAPNNVELVPLLELTGMASESLEILLTYPKKPSHIYQKV